MRKNKLVAFLALLSKKEIADFKKYLASPIFNTRESMQRLFEVLEEEYIDGPGTAEKEVIYHRVFGGDLFREASLKASMSNLLGLLRDFLAFHEFQSDKIAQNRYFLRKLNTLQDDKFFPKYHQSALKDLDKSDLTSADHFQEIGELTMLHYQYMGRGPGRPPQDHLKEVFRNRSFSFLARMMRYNNATINRKYSFSEVFEPEWMRLVQEYVASHLDELPPILNAYHQIYQALSKASEPELFEKARAFLQHHYHEFNSQEKVELYTSCLNHAARQLNHGKPEYLEVVFSIYQEMLEIGLIVTKGKISPWHLKNIVNVAARLKKFSWAEDFIEKWQGKVVGEYKNNTQNYNLGMLRYYKGEFEQAERNFNSLLDDYKDIFYGINARGYLLQIYFETGNSRGLEALCHSFRMFLDRSPEVAEVKRRQHITFINHLRRFTGIPLNDSNKLKALREEILQKDQRGMGSQWLLSKIDQQLSGKG